MSTALREYCDRLLRQLSDCGNRLEAQKLQIERLQALLNDETYIKCKADYLRGHLSHAGYLESKEREVLG